MKMPLSVAIVTPLSVAFVCLNIKMQFSLQNLLLFNRCLPGLHEVVRDPESRGLSNAEAKPVLEKIKQATQALNQRLFIIMTAQAKGWAWARELEFLETGDKK